MGASASESLVRLAQIFANKDLRLDNNLQTIRTILDALDYNLYYQNKVRSVLNLRITTNS